MNDFKEKFPVLKKELSVYAEKFNSSERVVYQDMGYLISEFLENAEWFFNLQETHPQKVLVPIRLCLEFFIEINYWLSQLFIGYSKLNRNPNALLLKRDLKTYKKFYDFASVQIVKVKRGEEFFDLERITGGYNATYAVAEEENIQEVLKVKNGRDIDKVNPNSLEDNIKQKIENASLPDPQYWWFVYSFLSEFIHPNSRIKRMVKTDEQSILGDIWLQNMMGLLNVTLLQSDFVDKKID